MQVILSCSCLLLLHYFVALGGAALLHEYSTILITGGTGTFACAMTAFLLQHTTATIRLFSRDELKQAEMQQAFGDNPRLRFFLGDVRDLARLHLACANVDLVFHAAALKRVDAGEYNVSEFIKTNVYGTENVISACRTMGIQRAIFISTDKSVNAINSYGNTKALAERLWQRANTYSPEGTCYNVVRYANVSGSRGSVIPLWRAQLAAGETPTITSTSMTRFHVSIDEAVRLAWFAAHYGPRGSVLVPHLPAYNVLDLLHAVAPLGWEAKGAYRVTGVRPGEKLAEQLMTDEETAKTVIYGDEKCWPQYYCIPPVAPSWPMELPGAWMSEEHCYWEEQACLKPYASDVWRWRLSTEALRERLREDS